MSNFQENSITVVGKLEFDAKSRGRSVHIGFPRKVISQEKTQKNTQTQKNKKYTMSMGVHRNENLIL